MHREQPATPLAGQTRAHPRSSTIEAGQFANARKLVNAMTDVCIPPMNHNNHNNNNTNKKKKKKKKV